MLVDEAYIHFSDTASVMWILVRRAGKDVLLLRTFSKIYGMAGAALRSHMLPVPTCSRKSTTTVVGNFHADHGCAGRRVSQPERRAALVPERKRVNARIRGSICRGFDRRSWILVYSIGSEYSLCSATTWKRPAETGDRRHGQAGNMYLLNIWPAMPTYSRVTIGTAPEMEQFQVAWQKVMTGA